MSDSTLLMIFIGLAALAAVVAVLVDSIPRVGDELPRDGLHADDLRTAPPSDRYARFENRDYSSDRGVVPMGPAPAVARFGAFVVPMWTDFYTETVRRLGDPMGA